jgi:hypothetical protein
MMTDNLLTKLQRSLLPQTSRKSEEEVAGWIGCTIQRKGGMNGRLWKPVSLPEGTEKPSPGICNSSIMAVLGSTDPGFSALLSVVGCLFSLFWL